MAVDLGTLSYDEFELVVRALLVRLGYRVTGQARRGQRGPDLEAVAPSGDPVFVEIKHHRQPIPRVIVEQFAGDIGRYRRQSIGAKGLFVVSSALSAAAAASIELHPELEVWTGDILIRMLEAHPDLLAAMSATTEAFQDLNTLSMLAPEPTPRPKSALYVERLAAITPGRTDWRLFESWCTQILTDIFSPDLGPPDQQSRTDDGLDIMDAVFPIRTGSPPWSQVRSEFITRFVVAEYKNHLDQIGAKQVESIAQYLWSSAKRQFGILVSRNTPGPSALAQRRRIWVQEAKMVVFLSDRDLIEMLKMREAEDEPFIVIDAQLEEFLRTLTP